jgi:hypothetical protein
MVTRRRDGSVCPSAGRRHSSSGKSYARYAESRSSVAIFCALFSESRFFDETVAVR